jgi:uncharacterized protein (TIGR03437 family)
MPFKLLLRTRGADDRFLSPALYGHAGKPRKTMAWPTRAKLPCTYRAPLSLFVLLAVVALGSPLLADPPFYTTASIVNSADGQAGPLAPNAIGTIYGTGLSYTTRALAPADVIGGVLPTTLPGTGATVLIGLIAANVFYVSPTQINFLVPSVLQPGRIDFRVVLNGIAGPPVPVDLAVVSPAMYQADAQTVIATRLDGSLVTADAPARPGDVIVLYATGLGDTQPPPILANIATMAAPLRQMADFKVLLDGAAVDRTLILYAGLAPGFAGLYQINVRLPDGVGGNPQIQIGLADVISPLGLKLPVKP